MEKKLIIRMSREESINIIKRSIVEDYDENIDSKDIEIYIDNEEKVKVNVQFNKYLDPIVINHFLNENKNNIGSRAIIPTIKFVRELTNCGLKEAKNYVEELIKDI
jgi:hypothetical protein